jgi:hypothetical protein
MLVTIRRTGFVEQALEKPVELRGFEPRTFCMPSTGTCEHASEKNLWTRGHRSLKSAKMRPGSLPLLHPVAAPRAYSGVLGCGTVASP